jgi:hypothetical protein
MNSLFRAITLSVLLLHTGSLIAEDTPLKIIVEEGKPVTLEEVVKSVMQDTQIKVLSAKTEVIEGKKVHIIKMLLIATGHIQYFKLDAATGKTLDSSKK